MPKVENITKKFGGLTVFNNFSLEFKTDKITAIAGVSGVGKTTLLNIIAGLEPCDGNVYCDRPVSYVFQTPRLIENVTVNAISNRWRKRAVMRKARAKKRLTSFWLPPKFSIGKTALRAVFRADSNSAFQ